MSDDIRMDREIGTEISQRERAAADPDYTPSVAELLKWAREEAGEDGDDAVRKRHHELMVEFGYVKD